VGGEVEHFYILHFTAKRLCLGRIISASIIQNLTSMRNNEVNRQETCMTLQRIQELCKNFYSMRCKRLAGVVYRFILFK